MTLKDHVVRVRHLFRQEFGADCFDRFGPMDGELRALSELLRAIDEHECAQTQMTDLERAAFLAACGDDGHDTPTGGKEQ